MPLKLIRMVRFDCRYKSSSFIISSVPIWSIKEALSEPTIRILSFVIVVTLLLFLVRVWKYFLSIRIIRIACVVALPTRHKVPVYYMICFLRFMVLIEKIKIHSID